MSRTLPCFVPVNVLHLVPVGVWGNFSLFKQVADQEKPLWATCSPGRKVTSRRSAESASRGTTRANKINADAEAHFKTRGSVQTLIRLHTQALRPALTVTALCYYRRCDRSPAHRRIYILIISLINGVAL